MAKFDYNNFVEQAKTGKEFNLDELFDLVYFIFHHKDEMYNELLFTYNDSDFEDAFRIITRELDIEVTDVTEKYESHVYVRLNKTGYHYSYNVNGIDFTYEMIKEFNLRH